MKVWRLKKGADRRLRQGHPWVFASELAHSSKEVSPGEIVELHDGADKFLAYGYTNPASQIAFRKLSSNKNESDVGSEAYFIRRLSIARGQRVQSGWAAFSHRWFFAEADGVPGLIIDLFKMSKSWLAVVQASTAGAERALPQIISSLKTFEKELGRLVIIEAPSSRSRVLEGLKLNEKKVVHGELEDSAIELVNGLKLRADFIGGQKTGFFLDQQFNAALLKRTLPRDLKSARVLDICCYVGQWGTHAAQGLKNNGCKEVEVTLLDTSAAALELARANVESVGARAEAIEGDALKALADLEENSFDVVICDPPAFVKKKADLDAGVRAYVKVNRDALRLVKPGGVFVSSSCSGLVKSADYQKVLQEASSKAGRIFKQVWQGGHGPDHPLTPGFPEGEYLKCLIGRVDFPF